MQYAVDELVLRHSAVLVISNVRGREVIQIFASCELFALYRSIKLT